MHQLIDVVCYQDDGALTNRYLALVEAKYRSERNAGYFLEDLREAGRFSRDQRQTDWLAVLHGDEMLAHVALIRDSQAGDGRAFWGFFECQDDPEVFDLLWAELRKLAGEYGIRKLLGPINGSIWHQYRFVKDTDGAPFFKSELCCEPFYHTLVKGVASAETAYYSAYRTEFRSLTSITEPYYRRMLSNGFSIVEPPEVTPRHMSAVLSISKRVFASSWGYTDLSMADFGSLYSARKIESHVHKMYFLQRGEEIAGYGSVLREDSQTLILKTMAIAPEFQSLGMANALIYKIHTDAQANRYRKVIYALIREDNGVNRLPKDDAVIFRRYAAFEFDV